MEITNNTKIRDLIPKGFEITENTICGLSGNDKNCELKITIYKKEEVKNFDYYIRYYFTQRDIRWNVSTIKGYVQDLFFREDYKNIPFEIKIGLLKFICDDLDLLFYTTYHYICNDSHTRNYERISKICPNQFLQETIK